MEEVSTLDCELCIIGAGYAGLNGLNVAAKYLARGDRVVVIDMNQTWGGQWLHQYEFVRLHQPYSMYTAGDQGWSSAREPSHLATKREVLAHLATVPAVSAGQLALTPLFGHRYLGHRVLDGRLEIDAASPASSARVRVRASRLLDATGQDVQLLPGFPLSSPRVRSLGAEDPRLRSAEFLDSDQPVYVIGSGKTGMDWAQHLIALGREVHVIRGSGMWFFSRDARYPSGLARYYRGVPVTDIFLRIARQFDGHNDEQVFEELSRDGLVLKVFDRAANCRFGLLSLGERERIRAGVRELHPGYLVDVEGTHMILRDQGQLRRVPVREGAWFINCTTHLRAWPHRPLSQDGGLTCAPQMCLGLSGSSAYYLTHLWYRGQLPELATRLFRTRLDAEPKLRVFTEGALAVMANMALITARLPGAVPMRYRGDLARWFPAPRRLLALQRVLRGRGEVLRKAERLLPLRYTDAPAALPASYREAEARA